MAGTGYTSVSDYLDANTGTLGRERSDLQNYVGNEYGGAKSAADALLSSAQPGQDYAALPGYSGAVDQINQAQQDQTNLGTYGGTADLLSRIYGVGQEGARFDAGLVGTQSRTNPDLLAYMNQGLSDATRPQPIIQSQGGGPRNNRPHGTPPPPPPPDPGYHYEDHPLGPEDGPPGGAPGGSRPEDWDRLSWRSA